MMLMVAVVARWVNLKYRRRYCGGGGGYSGGDGGGSGEW